MPKRVGRTRADIQLPPEAPDGEIYVRGTLAAAVLGVTPRRILQWRAAGLLDEAYQEPGGRRLLIYRYSDVLAADRLARGIAA